MNVMDKTFDRAKSDTIVDERVIKALQSDFEALRKDIDRLKNNAMSNSETIASDAARRLERELEELTVRAREAIDDAGKASREQVDEVRTRVRENPLSSVGGALAIGLMVGRLMGRR